MRGAPAVLAGQAPPELAGGTRRQRAAVLMVDDDPRNLLALEGVLEELDADLIGVRSGHEALREMLARDFAVVLLDINMPGMDGYEVAAMIRKRQRTRYLPIIFVTGVNKAESHMFQGYSAGAVDYVVKPVHPVVLKSKVGVFVELFNQRQQLASQIEAKARLLDENTRIQGELRRSQETQSNIIKALPLVIYSRDLDVPGTPITVYGSNVEQLFGVPPRRFAEQPDCWEARIHAEDRERVAAELERLVADGRDGELAVTEYRVTGPGGQARIVFDQRVLVRDEDGRAVRILGSWLDVTERRNAESQLAQMQKMDAIGQLTGGIAHDFNNMLAVVIGSLDRLRKLVAEHDKAAKHAETALQGALRCSDLTRRLLTFARRQRLEPQPVHIHALVASMTDLLHRTLEDEIELEIAACEMGWTALADPTQIESALVNLVVNARDAMPEGGKVTIGIANVTLPEAAGGLSGDFVALSVTDSGTGMTPEVRARAFEPFFTTKKSGRGTGLGLSIIYGLVTQLGGEVLIDSEEGAGTTVTMLLPRASDCAPQSMAPLLAPDDAHRAHDGEVVLVVEDDPGVRYVSSSLLRELGYAVVNAPDGMSALAVLESGQRIDLLFTDVAMPGGLNGYEVAERAHAMRPGIRTLFTSGYADFVLTKGRTTSSGALLKKPFRDRDLARAVREALDARADRPLETTEV